MAWGLMGLAGAAIMGFWFIYDRVKERDPDMHAAGAEKEETDFFAFRKPEVWECPVCGRKHTEDRRSEEPADGRIRCPFEDGEEYVITQDNQPERMITNNGGHFELSYLVWKYGDMIYLTYISPGSNAVVTEQYGRTYVNAYYTTRFCPAEEWRLDMLIDEMNMEISRLRDRVMNSMYVSGAYYVVGVNHILDMSVTKDPLCSGTGYVIWKGKQGINITGLRTGASDDMFNYDRVTRSASLHRFCRFYTRELCGTIEELREMSQDNIDAEAYGAYMDGAK